MTWRVNLRAQIACTVAMRSSNGRERLQVTVLAEIYSDPIFFGPSPGFVNRTQSDPGFVNPVRSCPGFANPI